MNNIQSLSKRIRKRIQISVKRLFTSKSPSYKSGNSPIDLILPDNQDGDKNRSSSESNFSVDERYIDRNHITTTNIEMKCLTNFDQLTIPNESGEINIEKIDNMKDNSSSEVKLVHVNASKF